MKKRIISIICLLTILIGMFAGCSKEKQQTPDVTKPTTNIQNKDENSSGELKEGYTTVASLKQKYGETDENKMLPLYNLSATEELEIPFKCDALKIDLNDFFSVHTDEKCLDASKVTMLSVVDRDKITTKPLMAPLSNSKTESIWGNVPIYYVKFNYDLESEELKKLEEPMIVPMTIKSEVNAPNVKYNITDGQLSISWSKIEGATSYKIYQRQIIKLFETTNITPTGKEDAYSGSFPMLIAEVDANTFEYQDWLQDGRGGISPSQCIDAVDGYINSYQNRGVNGEYYVTAVKDGKESLFSIGICTSNMNLPKEVASGESILYNTYESEDDLPKNINVLYVDGSVKAHTLTYIAKEDSNMVTYKIDGTQLVGVLTVKGGYNNEETNDDKDSAGGFVVPENDIPQTPSNDVPTINKVENKTETPNTPEETKPNETTPPTETTEPNETIPVEPENETLIEQQIENTKEVVEEGNKETVYVPEDIKVTANSAAEEYLALSLIAGNNEISLAAFPELQTWERLTDVLQEVVYQNPMVLAVTRYSYSYADMVLTVEYDYTADEIKAKQAEIQQEGAKIITEIIDDNMSDAEKRKAIYHYLEDNTRYDDAALENAEKNNFAGVDKSFRDSFTTYGILVKKVGVCQSYAMAFDYLCELANVECIVVTGDMYGYLPHAWNKVQIGNEWFVIDATNNETSLGIEYFMFENPDSIAYALGYIEDDMYYQNGKSYTSQSIEYSKYRDIMMESKEELTQYIKEHAKAGAEIEILAVYDEFDSDDVVEALQQTNVTELGDSIVLCGYVYFEIKK